MTGVNLGTLFAKLLLEDDFSATFNKYIQQQDAAEKKTQAVANGFKVAGAAMAAFGAASINAATDLNKSMANIATLIPNNRKRIDELKESVQGLSVELGKSTEDLSSGLYELISSLGDSADNVKILEINAKAAAAGLATTQDAIKFTSAVTKTYGDTSAEAFQKVSDLGFQAVNLGQTTFPELAESIGRVAPLAKETGVSMEEMFAVVATATGVTGNTNEVMTQMAAAITALVSPTKDLQETYDKLGVSGGEALIKQKGLVGALQAVAKGAREADKPLIDLLGRKEAWIIASSLAGAQAESFSQKLESMGKVAGATDTAFKEQTQGIAAAAHQWEVWKQQVNVALQDTGDAILNSLTPALQAAVIGFSEMGGKAIASAGDLAQVAIAAKMLGGTQVLSSVGSLASSLTGVTTAAQAARFGLIGIGIAIAAWSLVKVYEALSLINDINNQTSEALKDAQRDQQMAARAIAEAHRATGLEVKNHAEALEILRAKSAGMRGELMTGQQMTAKMAEAWAIGAKETGKYQQAQDQVIISVNRAKVATQEQTAVQSTLVTELARVNKEVASLTGAQKEQIDAGMALNMNAKDIFESMKKLPKGVQASEAAIQAYINKVKVATKGTKDLDEELKKLTDSFSGKTLIDAAKKTADAMENMVTVTKREWDQLAPIFGDAIEKMVKRGETKTPEFKRLSALWLKAIGETMQSAPSGVDNDQFFRNFFGQDHVNVWSKFFQRSTESAFSHAVQNITGPATSDWTKMFSGLGETAKVSAEQWAPNFLDGLMTRLNTKEFGEKLGMTLIGALQNGANARQIGASIGGTIGTEVGKQIGAQVASSIGGLAGGIVGNAVIPVLGGILGSMLGAYIGGLFGGGSEEATAAKQMRDQILQNIGGKDSLQRFQEQGELVANAFFQGLRAPHQRPGVSDEDINTILTSNDPEKIQNAWDRMQPVIEAVQKTFEGLALAITGTNRIANGLSQSLTKSMEEQVKAHEAAQKAMLQTMKEAGASQEELDKKQAYFTEENKNRVFAANEVQIGSFNRLATIAGADLVNLAGRTGDLVGALMQLQPTFDVLIEARDKFGLTDQMSAATAEVLHFYEVVKNNADVFDTVAGVGQVLTGFGEAMLENTELFNALGGELAAQVGILQERGVATNEIFAMMAPQLQALWEAAESGKVVVDETTQALLDQAEAQGVVGEAHKDVNEQILSVLTEIRDLWGVSIPSAVDETGRAIERVGRQNAVTTNQSRNAAHQTGEAWEAAQRKITEDLRRQQEIQRNETERTVRHVSLELKKIPNDFPINCRWVPPGDLELPPPPTYEVPVEFEMPEGRQPWDEGYYNPNTGETHYPGRTSATEPTVPDSNPYQAAGMTVPAGDMEGGRGTQTIIVERDGQRDLQFTAENLPNYVRVRAGASVLGA